jgi:hypothetical protein
MTVGPRVDSGAGATLGVPTGRAGSPAGSGAGLGPGADGIAITGFNTPGPMARAGAGTGLSHGVAGRGFG